MQRHREWKTLHGTIEPGHRVASGQAQDGPYPASTIAMQKPFFKQLGLDLTGFYDGTLNVAIAPYRFSVQTPSYCFPQVEWTSLHPPETFSFSPSQVLFEDTLYKGWLYYPHPETKKTHFQEPSIVELLMPWIAGIRYGKAIAVLLDTHEINLYR